MLEEHKKALVELEAAYDEIVAALKVKNEFVENLEEHLEISEQHMSRIEMSMYEDL